MGIELMGQQKKASRLLTLWFKSVTSKQVFNLSGRAGTGKTTIVKVLMDVLGLKSDEVLFVAFTGKASLVLSMKGNYAQTIHSSIYNVIEEPLTDEAGNIIIKNGRVLTQTKFVKRSLLENDEKIKLIVVDEAGMVPEKMAMHLLSFGKPIIAIGDLNQLDPVMGKSYFLQDPDIDLTEIMRQAENSPIIHLANMVLDDKQIQYGRYGNSFVLPETLVNNKILTESDVIITATNRARHYFNERMKHDILGRDMNKLCIGDKLLCKTNNKALAIDYKNDIEIYLVNGMVGYVEDISLENSDAHGKFTSIDFRPDFIEPNMDNNIFEDILLENDFLYNPDKKPTKKSYYNRFNYGWAITCHAGQGSSWKIPFIAYENIGDYSYMKKWLYTAITRAEENVFLCLPSQRGRYVNWA